MKSEHPDYSRNVYSLLGLPFDALTLDEAVAHIRRAIALRSPCFVSTPNLNFLITAQENPSFRDSVVRSDLSLADGMPIVWLARLMGIPIVQRVAGSDLFEALRNGNGPKVKVYFFGGPPGVAERAAQQINSEGRGMVCVGFASPGYGSVEAMSTAETLTHINASEADFLVVALGAAKGQAWIEHNLNHLQVPIVSHLGAVVNFVAGNVRRAPHWMQKTGLEWAWRIGQEPALWRRYAADAVGLLKLLVTHVAPLLVYKFLRPMSPAELIEATIECEHGQAINLRLEGRQTLHCGAALRATLLEAGDSCKKISVRFTHASWLPGDLLATFQHLNVDTRATLEIQNVKINQIVWRQFIFTGCDLTHL